MWSDSYEYEPVEDWKYKFTQSIDIDFLSFSIYLNLIFIK